MKYIPIILISTFFSVFTIGVINVSAQQTFLSCGDTNCNGDTRQCELGFSCTYVSDSSCGTSGTICVPTPATSNARGTIPGTTFERRICTTSDVGNNFLFNSSNPTKVWTSAEVLDQVCNPQTTNTNTNNTNTNTNTSNTNTSNTNTNQTTTTTSTNTLPNTSGSGNKNKSIIIYTSATLLIVLGLTLKFRSTYKR
ncbi:MAG: hypothetical protein Q9M91_08115 [Candidatus Dojkabacteria bacterium]|nr:hypothetical protein [Candidatus Dojkabacteria bacterium]MDQ7021745.1 hypothetical protein [Candidatus Dojkabacteria bacterium]